MMASAERSVFALPRAHLHAHLVLSARVETTHELAERYGVDLTDAWTFSSLPEFIARSALAFEEGICGDETLGSFGPFTRAFEIAREAGLLVVPHAGETVGPESVRAALDLLRPDRIAHGVRAVEDPELLRRLADEQIPCDVCPTSNVLLGVAETIEMHQLPAMLAAGVPVTLSSDDQLYFGSEVGEEYALVRRALGLTDEQLAAIARTSARASGASTETKARMLAGIDTWLRADENATKNAVML